MHKQYAPGGGVGAVDVHGLPHVMTLPALPQGKRFLTIRQTAQAYPALTEGALRRLRFNGDANGFNRGVLAVGRKLLIDVEEFERWLEAPGCPGGTARGDGRGEAQRAAEEERQVVSGQSYARKRLTQNPQAEG